MALKLNKAQKQTVSTHQTPIDAAKTYKQAGLAPLPVEPESKKPKIKEWQKTALTETEIPKHFEAHDNVAICHGLSDTVAVDLDCDEAVALAKELLPHTPCKTKRASKACSHFVYCCTSAGSKTSYEVADQGMVVELLRGSTLTLMPPSTHPESEEPLTFVDDEFQEPASVEKPVLERAVLDLAIAAVLLRIWPENPGCRHDLALAVAGGLLNSGLDADRCAKVVALAAKHAGDPESEDRKKAVHDTAAKINNGAKVKGWPKVEPLLGDEINPAVEALRTWLATNDNTPGTNDPETVDLDQIVIPAPELIQLDLPERENIIGDWMKADSITIVSAQPKVGKTWLSLEMARSAALGQPFLGWPVPKERNVLYVDGEMSRRELQDRTTKLACHDAPRFRLLTSSDVRERWKRPLDLAQEPDQHLIRRALEKYDIELLVLDPLSMLMRWEENDNSSPELRSFLDWLISLRDSEIATVIAHHAPHGQDRPRGASKLMGIVDNVLVLNKKGVESQGEFKMSFDYTRGPVPTPAQQNVMVRETEAGVVRLEPTLTKKPDTATRILQVICYDNPPTQKAICEALELSKSHVSNTLKELREDGLVEKYALKLTQKGEKRLALS